MILQRQVELMCARCHVVHASGAAVFNIDDEMKSVPIEENPDVWDQIENHVITIKWAVMLGRNGKRELVCDSCIQKASEPPKIGKFIYDARCAKCNRKDITLLYQTGREPAALVNIEHLRCTCVFCRFTWPVHPADKFFPEKLPPAFGGVKVNVIRSKP